MASSSSPPKVKTPLPMVPVPQALETVLTETAKSLWFMTQQQQQQEASTTTASDTTTSSSPPLYHQLLGRISTKDIATPFPGYPDHNASIMDGYAIKTSDCANFKEAYEAIVDAEQKETFRMEFDIVGKVYAGDDDDDDNEDEEGNATSSALDGATAVYVTTGAVVPDGYDAVIPIEETAILPNNNDNNNNNNKMHRMHILPAKIQSVMSTKPNTWIRPIGCDIPSEYIVLAKGEVIRPVHMALLAQVGIRLEDVAVQRLPRVGVLSTGNEVLSSSSSSSEIGKIPDANRPLLLSQLSTYGNCIPIDLGIVSDDDGYDAIAQRLNHHLWSNSSEGKEGGGGMDILITTGGISMGEKDIMEQVFVDGMGGKVHFGRMNMKPGKPTTFITIDRDVGNNGQQCRKIIFALPGNPVSASVCSELLVRPCLDLLHYGVDTTNVPEPLSMESYTKHAVDHARVHEEAMVTITADIKLDQGRPEYRRVTLQRVPCVTDNSHSHGNNNHEPQKYVYHATHTGVQRSSRVLSLRGADGLMMMPRGGPNGCGLDVAPKGMEFPLLLFSPLSVKSETCFKDSMHRRMGKKPKYDHHHNHHHHHHDKSKKTLAVGVIVCASDEQRQNNDFQSIDATLLQSLGGGSHVSVVKRAICKVPSDANDDEFSNVINGPSMEGTNVIFVVVPAYPLPEDGGSSTIAFKAGLDVSHALGPILTKKANAMALQVRKSAASQDPMAALFENVVGIARGGTAVLITCSDRGLEGAAAAVTGLLGHLTSLLTSTTE